MPNTYGFMHVYATPYGVRIFEEQLERIEYLTEETKAILVGIVGSEKITIPSDFNNLALFRNSNPLHYEGWTLQKMWLFSHCCSPDDYFWYIHTKGASASDDAEYDRAACWRNQMESIVIDGYKYCKAALNFCDVYGAHYFPSDDPEKRRFIPGNFWWTTAGLIQSLPSPIEWLTIAEVKGTPKERFGFETWIGHATRSTLHTSYTSTAVNVAGLTEWDDNTLSPESNSIITQSQK